ncbi:hypothetical protein Kfla_6721 [Kribbella flavida DSM 17836]|uniref:Uncharacterized protein n=1 Tax=Kribbella flavida (strain DSM 17836 / JCM 10339 / NBRC 14399) TaxID=479435 RepID=D2Q112_KRIFD|nr:hypothetical protein [Kribbella flavida]ADB35713.1 hypothetical protein Kfla_6721 [Kribbella flavida DSM 17836]
MAVCDFCSDTGVTTRYPAEAVQAAAASGFRPTGALEMGNQVARTLGLTDLDLEGNWVAQVMGDSTDWALCASCAASLEQHVAGDPAAPSRPAAPAPTPSNASAHSQPVQSTPADWNASTPRRRWWWFGRRRA